MDNLKFTQYLYKKTWLSVFCTQ